VAFSSPERIEMCFYRSPSGRERGMRSCDLRAAGALTMLLALAACVAPPAAPTIPVIPGPGKSFAVFDAEEAACEQEASARLAPAVFTYNKFSVGSVALGAAFGAGIGGAAAAGSGAATGAAAGAAFGTAANAVAAGRTQSSLQRQYDTLYAFCMINHGNRLPQPRAGGVAQTDR
jgi:hypothetical protein